MKTEVNAAKAALQSATTTLDSVRLQYDEQLEELQDDKTALRVMFEDDKVVAAGLRHDLKRTEATIAQLNTRLTTLNSGSKDLQVNMAAAAATEATSMVKWDAERQQLQDEIARVKCEERRTKEAIRRARAEDDDNKQCMIRRARDSKDPGTSK